jgi:hypothetical protein
MSLNRVIKIIDAQQARTIAESIDNQTNSAILNNIFARIEAASTQGKYSIRQEKEDMNNHIEKFLRNLGYTVSHEVSYDQRDYWNYYLISWSQS